MVLKLTPKELRHTETFQQSKAPGSYVHKPQTMFTASRKDKRVQSHPMFPAMVLATQQVWATTSSEQLRVLLQTPGSCITAFY